MELIRNGNAKSSIILFNCGLWHLFSDLKIFQLPQHFLLFKVQLYEDIKNIKGLLEYYRYTIVQKFISLVIPNYEKYKT